MSITNHPAPNVYTSKITMVVQESGQKRTSCSYTYTKDDGVESQQLMVSFGGATSSEERMLSLAQSDANKGADKALRAGFVLHRTDGAKVWRERSTVMDFSQDRPSDRYTWHEDGARVLCRWFEYTQHEGSEATRRPMRDVWVNVDNAG